METIEVIRSGQRRRRWMVGEKKVFVAEAEQPGISLSSVASK